MMDLSREYIFNKLKRCYDSSDIVELIDQIINETEDRLKALQYDKGQYEQGYADGFIAATENLIKCNDCRWFVPRHYPEGYDGNCEITGCEVCNYYFCNHGERKDVE